jgi:eukaryotic-like serine/threonine-protein kinase
MQHVTYEFGPFHLDENQRVLFSGDRPVAIPPKELDTLVILVQNHGRVVDKQELMDSVWPNVFVEEGNLARHISYLRRRLGDSASGGQYVETVPKRGYRFVAPVRVLIREGGDAGDANQAEPRRERSRWRSTVWAIVGLSLAVLLAVTVWRTFPGQNRPFQEMTIRRLTDTGNVGDAAISADGKYLAYVQSDGGLHSLWIKHLGTSSDVRIVPGGNKRYIGVTIAPDNDYVYFALFGAHQVGIGTLYKVPILGGAPVQVLNDVDTPVSFSPDGRQFVFRRDFPSRYETTLVIANIDGSGEKSVWSSRTPANLLGMPSWSSDPMKVFSYVAMDTPEAGTAIVKIDVSTGKAEYTARSWIANGQMASLGRTALASSLVQESTRGRGQIVWMSDAGADPVPITNDLNSYSMHLSATTRGTKLVSVQQSTLTQIWMLSDLATSAAVQITDTQEGLTDVRWTNMGRLITKSRSGDLSIREGDGSRRVTIMSPLVLSFGEGCDGGRYIVYSALLPGTRLARIFRADADGGNPTEITHGDFDSQVVCSPVGREIYFYSVDGGKVYLKKTDVDGTAPKRLITKSFFGAGFVQLWRFSLAQAVYDWRLSISNDGRKLLMGFNEGNGLQAFRHRLGVLDTNTEKFVFTMDIDTEQMPRGGRFTPDGRALILVVQNEDAHNLWLVPMGAGERKQLTFFKSDWIFDFDFSPDGKRLALVRGKQPRDAVLITDISR